MTRALALLAVGYRIRRAARLMRAGRLDELRRVMRAVRRDLDQLGA